MATEVVTPLVAVWMLTYNHELFIAQAIEGIMQQKANFPFKLYIGEDCSTDNTREICFSYKKKFPESIELIFTANNNLAQNAKNIYEACFASGAKYVALCEGDDYWCDPNKLQIQVSFLQNNPNFVLCGGNTKVIYENDSERTDLIRPDYTDCQAEIITLEDQIKYDIPFHTSTILFRNIIELPPTFYSTISGDIFLYTLLMEKGSARYLNEIFSVHRKHSFGLTSLSKQDLEKKYGRKTKMYKDFNSYFNFKYDHLYRKSIFHNLSQLILLYNRSGQYSKAYTSIFELYSYKRSSFQFFDFLLKNLKISIGRIVKGGNALVNESGLKNKLS